MRRTPGRSSPVRVLCFPDNALMDQTRPITHTSSSPCHSYQSPSYQERIWARPDAMKGPRRADLIGSVYECPTDGVMLIAVSGLIVVVPGSVLRYWRNPTQPCCTTIPTVLGPTPATSALLSRR